MLPTRRFYQPRTRTRITIAAEVCGDQWEVRVVEQRKDGTRSERPAEGPVSLEAALARADAIGAELAREGYEPSGLGWALEDLAARDDRRKGHGARRAGRIGDPRAFEPLLKLLAGGWADLHDVARALGRLGDDKAAILLRELASSPDQHKRRAGVEALRLLGPTTSGLGEVADKALARIAARDPEVGALLRELPANGPATDALHIAVGNATAQKGELIDDLYELGTPVAVAAVLHWLRSIPLIRGDDGRAWCTISRKDYWVAVKSVFKRAIWRRDAAVIGRLAYIIERSRSGGGWHKLAMSLTRKPGYTSIFSAATRRWALREVERTLGDLGRNEPAGYTRLAVEILLQYGLEDGRGRSGMFVITLTRSMGQHRIETGGGGAERNAELRRDLRRDRSRHEPFPELWNADGAAVVRLFAEARSREVARFAYDVYRDAHADRGLLEGVDDAVLIAMLDGVLGEVAQLGIDELRRRFDPAAPDLDLIDRLIGHDAARVRGLGDEMLERSVGAWRGDAERVRRFLCARHPETRAVVGRLAAEILAGTDGAWRGELLRRLLIALRVEETSEGVHAELVRFIRTHLLDELVQRTPAIEALDTLATGSPAARELMGSVLARLEVDPEEVGFGRIVDLADDEVASVRAAGRGLIERGIAHFRDDPSAVLCLLESDWDDTRVFAIDLARDRLDLLRLGIDGVVGLCDSNRSDVQDLGWSLVRENLASLPIAELYERLAEHPAPRVRLRAAELVLAHAAPGPDPMLRLRGFFKRVLFSVRQHQHRAVKRRLVVFLRERALEDATSARVVIDVLGELVHAHGRLDLEGALETLAAVKLRWPELDVPLALEGPACS